MQIRIVAERQLRRATRPDDGMVTAEAALVLPLVAAFALAVTWLTSIGIDQVRVVDAARDAARAVARGGDDLAAAQAARRTAGSDADVVIHHDAGLVTVTVTVTASPPSWLLVPMPAVDVKADSTVEAEVDGEPS